MYLLDMIIPAWMGQAVMTVASLGIGGYIWELYKRKFPTKKEGYDAKKAEADFFGQKFSLGLTVYEQLTKQVDLMVEEKTKHFSEIMFKKDMAHLDEIKTWEKRMDESHRKLDAANAKIILLEKRIEELEKDKYQI